MVMHVRHQGEAHPAVVTITLLRVDNVEPNTAYYMKFNYKREASKTKSKRANPDGTAEFNHRITLHTTLYEEHHEGTKTKKIHQYDPKIMQLRLKQSKEREAAVSQQGTVKGGHIDGKLVCDYAMNLVEYVHPFNTSHQVDVPLTDREEEGPMLTLDIKCTLVHTRRRGPRHIGDGSVMAVKLLAIAFAYAFIGLFWDPYINTKQYGIYGLFKGIAKALLGLCLRPIIGIVQFVVSLMVGLCKTPQTCLKALCLKKAARDDKIIGNFKEQFPKFSIKELAALHEQFLDMADNGEYLTRSSFTDAFAVLGMQQTIIAERLFDQFAGHGGNKVDVKQFLTAMYVMMQGSVEEKLYFAFDMYDLDSNGTISEPELKQIFGEMERSFSTMKLGSIVSRFPQVRDVWPQFAEQGYELGREEFVQGMIKNPDVVKRLGFMTNKNQGFSVERKGISVGFMSRSWQMMLNMMLGMREACITTEDRHRALTPEDFAEKRVVPLPAKEIAAHSPGDTEQHEATHEEKEYEFCDYGSLAFAQIRDSFGISPKEYMRSLGPEALMSNLLLGNLCTLSEIMSEGKSGSFFYFSHDMRFMVKTISLEEFFKFRAVLMQYHNHVIKNPHTLLSRLLGLYKLKITDRMTNRSDRMMFIVMNNLFYTDRPPFRRYDLKGSTQGRISTPEERKENSVALKDLDFKESPEDAMMLSSENAKLLEETIKSDSELLAEMQIMDYSLLLGIHRLEDPSCELPRDEGAPPFERDAGGMRSVNPDGSPGGFVYFVGIIDILIPYSARKAAEHAAKSIIHDPKTISAVPPLDYAHRFQDFMLDNVVKCGTDAQAYSVDQGVLLNAEAAAGEMSDPRTEDDAFGTPGEGATPEKIEIEVDPQ
eukprot:TRINITY_DN1669_c0_g2_i1.p1 TRINITY_DN1669_c0_g2~~TRINITY_DN1669_c0_g2_i1.p1  ORF type:complete len:876 (+),score=250.00 TRINITY_DN1669_c0_g2_i1:69-2696(+)